MRVLFVTMASFAVFGASLTATGQPATRPAGDEGALVIHWPARDRDPSAEGVQTFSGRFTAETLGNVLADRPDLMPLPLQVESERRETLAAIERIDMGALIKQTEGFLRETFKERFDPARDLIVAPVPEEQRVTVDLTDAGLDTYRGPDMQVIGFVVHGLTQEEFMGAVLRIVTIARQLLATGDPVYDRTSSRHFEVIAAAEAEAIRRERQARIAEQERREEVRRRVGQMLGVYNPQTGGFDGDPKWQHESRRFTYVIDKQTGAFIDRLQPEVARINRDMDLSGFAPPAGVGRPGIHFDPDLGDVELVLPAPLMREFLEQTDSLEQRMAAKVLISIEAVRLTDRDIIDGAVAARLNAQVQGVHDVQYYNTDGVIRQLGINSLLAVANQQLQVQTLRGVAAGAYPDGVTPITIAQPALPPLDVARESTTIGSDFSVGADDIFFDGRQQSYGFSYISPDGHEHLLSLDVVDSLREFWSRIERNLLVHKIKKMPTLTKFKVPVGPHEQTYEGIAALISQEDQQLIVATGTGAISEISATAGTWLIIQDFDISPIPGSSTSITDQEAQEIHDKVLLTMWLRDPATPAELKRSFLETPGRDELHASLTAHFEQKRSQLISATRLARSYGEVYEDRHTVAFEEAAAEKKEKNSVIGLTFYSSQGNIIQTPGSTQLGSANDLTSFTTELRPNKVTPISSFLTKTLDSARGTSALTGVRKGESNSETKTMTHLLIRARFPTIERERKDLEEGRQLGYFELPVGREPLSTVHLPFLSSSEHPLERLAAFRVGAMFEALQANRVRKPLAFVDPNVLEGKVPPQVYATAMTRFLLNRKIINDSPNNNANLWPEFRNRFVAEVRSLLEYDPDFFDAPNVALRNTAQWNNPDRIVLALNGSPGQFALERLTFILDDVGAILVPDDYAEQYLAKAPGALLGGHRVYPLDGSELQVVRRDVANHFLRLSEAYGDAFMEAVSAIYGLGTYRAIAFRELVASPLRGCRDLVVFDLSGSAHLAREGIGHAHEQFLILKSGGIQGGWFQPSLETLEDLDKSDRAFIVRGRDVLELTSREAPGSS